MPHVILVDETDAELGTMEKQRAHVEGRLHRAISVFVFNARGDTLLQRRASSKYHTGGLWTNACCSHPLPGEAPAAAARRRLREEMGIDAPMSPAFAFTYRAEVGGGLVEHEYDHVFRASWEGDPSPDPAEVEGWRWISPAALEDEVARDAGAFTPWFRTILARPEWPGIAAGGTPPAHAPADGANSPDLPCR